MLAVELLNDGTGTAEAGTPGRSQGNGLPGLEERVSGLGGTLEAGPLLLEGKPHFRLHVVLPLPPQAEVTALPEEQA